MTSYFVNAQTVKWGSRKVKWKDKEWNLSSDWMHFIWPDIAEKQQWITYLIGSFPFRSQKAITFIISTFGGRVRLTNPTIIFWWCAWHYCWISQDEKIISTEPLDSSKHIGMEVGGGERGVISATSRDCFRMSHPVDWKYFSSFWCRWKRAGGKYLSRFCSQT